MIQFVPQVHQLYEIIHQLRSEIQILQKFCFFFVCFSLLQMCVLKPLSLMISKYLYSSNISKSVVFEIEQDLFNEYPTTFYSDAYMTMSLFRCIHDHVIVQMYI